MKEVYKKIYYFVLFCFQICQLNAINRYVLKQNGLQINVISQNENFFQTAFIGIQEQMASTFPNGEEFLDVICTKLTPGIYNGAPQVFVNSVKLNQTNRCFDCLEQRYFFNTSALIRDSKYEIECRLEGSFTKSVKSTFYRIYADSMPRIRNGSLVYPHGNIVVHSIGEKMISCESVKENTISKHYNPKDFDSINWYDDRDQILRFPFTIVELSNKRIQNFSTLFLDTSDKVQETQMYRCCTSLLGQLVQCQDLYVVKPAVTTTTFRPYEYTAELNVHKIEQLPEQQMSSHSSIVFFDKTLLILYVILIFF